MQSWALQPARIVVAELTATVVVNVCGRCVLPGACSSWRV